MKKRKKIILLSLLIIFIIFTILVFLNKLEYIDNLVIDNILHIRNNKLTNTMITITNISSSYMLIVICSLLLLIMKKKRIPILIIINLLFSFLTNSTLKLLLQRERPLGINLIEASGYSYPSGHSFTSLAFFGFIIYLIIKLHKNKAKKIIYSTLLIILVSLIGFSRIYLGVHYTSDVLAGFMFGIIYLGLFIELIKKYLEEKI